MFAMSYDDVAVAAPKLQQLYDSPPTAESAGMLPDIRVKPNSTATSAKIRPLASSAPAGVAAGASSSSSGGAGAVSWPLTPAQAIERYAHVLTDYEKAEIAEYPEVYFVGQLAKKINAAEGKGPNCGFDDDKGRYKTVKNDHIAYRFEVLKGLGRGSFGDVVRAHDHKANVDVAIKVIRNERRFHKQAQTEIKILDVLRKQDKGATHHLIHLRSYFLFRGHLCLTFDMLGPDLYSTLKKDGFKGFSLPRVQNMTGNILSCLRLLRRQHITHLDLKPENLLTSGKAGDDAVTVIDFGSACFDHYKPHTYVQSRFYRAPEVILGIQYGPPADMWSLGCVLSELYTGHPIFPGRDEKEQLLYICELLGLPPPDLLASAKRTSVFFDAMGQLRQLQDRKGRKRLPATRSLSKATGSADPAFLDFIARCLVFDPAQRMTPREASKHPFVTGTTLATTLDEDLPEQAAMATTTTTTTSAAASAAAPPAVQRRTSNSSLRQSSSSSRASAAAAAATTSPPKRSAFGSLVGLLSPKSRRKQAEAKNN